MVADSDTVRNIVRDPERLDTLEATGLLDSPAEEPFDRLTRLASFILDTPVSLVSLVDADRQFFKSAIGLPEPFASDRETPLSHSFCQYVVADSSALVVEDARQHPVLKDNLAIPDLDVIGYLGIPLKASNGQDLGSFCVIDSKPRQWTQHEIEIVRELAQSVMTEIELREQIKARTETEEQLRKRNQRYRRVYILAERTIEHMRDTIARGANGRELDIYLEDMHNELKKLDNS